MSNVTVAVDHHRYEVIENVRNGWNEEAFCKRYSDILNKFDYIVGDWGYQQLRLRGFYEDQNQKSTFDTKISTLVDYLVEYCSFGCAYFVLKKKTNSRN
ncbi:MULTISPECIES: YutD family protein [unclassified Sporolactobacillus]|uniref:YutD family protein n=1 Tax=unclassified Sporolactobacillus TaxID=2628533 RepID=UPI002368C9B1|nr:YutD family protein [Sporolactobacillus sp. CQH2019]MDD9147393.1 YutD family protein [Sporolactobacillus sp. CQH2019]